MKIIKIVLWFMVVALGTIACYLALIAGERAADKVGIVAAWLANKLEAKNMPAG